jgi:prevent-host-death family protein
MIVTVENFEENFDEYMERVESGEVIKISHNDKVVAVVPYDEYDKCVELIRLYTEHDEGS